MRQAKKIIQVSIGIFVFISVSSIQAQDSSGIPLNPAVVDSCRAFLSSIKKEGILQEINPETIASTDVHKLSEMWTPGEDGKTLIEKHMWVILNASQRVSHLIHAQGVREIPHPVPGRGFLRRYAFFSDGPPLVGGDHIVQQYLGIETLVQVIKDRANGDTTAKSIATPVGAPGSGKTAVLSLLRKGLLNATLYDPKHFLFRGAWTNLHEIPSLKGYLPSLVTQPPVDPTHPSFFIDPLNDSPFAFLSVNMQTALLEKYSDSVRNVVGHWPRPKSKLSLQSEKIRNDILTHYTHQKGSKLTEEEEIQILDHHLVLVRHVLGTINTTPLLGNQGREPNLTALFGSSNPGVKFFDATHPFAHAYGLILKANGGVLMLDELGKNDPTAFLGSLLKIFSEGSVTVGGMDIPVDILFLAASNPEDFERLLSKDPNSPLIDRLAKILWNLLLDPTDIGHILAMQANRVDVNTYQLTTHAHRLEVRRLGEKVSQEFQPLDTPTLMNLFPDRKVSTPIVTPHRRYALRIGAEGSEPPLYISPLAMEFMAYVTALTRRNFDQDNLRVEGTYPFVGELNNVFTDRVTRLRTVLGLKTVSDTIHQQLADLSVWGEEGTFGITHRDMERWWEKAKQEASKSNNHSTITPALLFKTLKDLIKENSLLEDNIEAQQDALLGALIVMHHFIAPAMQQDLDLAFGLSGDRALIYQIYDEVLTEISARHKKGEDATTYTNHANQERAINKKRLDEIGIIYQKLTGGKVLSASEIALWQMFFERAKNSEGGDQSEDRHPELLNAIATWRMNNVLEREGMTLQRLLDVALNLAQTPTATETGRAGELMNVLENQLGYNLPSAQSALQIISSMSANNDPKK